MQSEERTIEDVVSRWQPFLICRTAMFLCGIQPVPSMGMSLPRRGLFLTGFARKASGYRISTVYPSGARVTKIFSF